MAIPGQESSRLRRPRSVLLCFALLVLLSAPQDFQMSGLLGKLLFGQGGQAARVLLEQLLLLDQLLFLRGDLPAAARLEGLAASAKENKSGKGCAQMGQWRYLLLCVSARGLRLLLDRALRHVSEDFYSWRESGQRAGWLRGSFLETRQDRKSAAGGVKC